MWPIIFLTIFSSIIASSAVESPEAICPCVSSPDVSVSKGPLSASGQHDPLLLCIEDTHAANTLLIRSSPEKLNLNYRFIKRKTQHNREARPPSEIKSDNSQCSVIMSIVLKDVDRHSRNDRCPGVCKDVPSITVPLEFLRPSSTEYSSTFTRCSLNLTVSTKVVRNSASLGHILRVIANRRLIECNEKIEHGENSWDYNRTIILNGNHHLTHSLPIVPPTRRRVYGVIVWVGSFFRIRMAEAQLKVLSLQRLPCDDSERIVGWIATEDVYPCKMGSHLCTDAKKRWQIDGDNMPSTFHQDPKTLPGWACAQRRPLRAMAHVLRLYEPEFMLVVDDDTFVNMKYLAYGSRYGKYILTTMKTQNMVLGDLTNARITTTGFFYGGGGYLMGRGALLQLESYVIQNRGQSNFDKYRSPKMLDTLGLLNTAVQLSSSSCAECLRIRPAPAIKAVNASTSGSASGPNITATADLTIRLIDLCVNMMAEMGTCYHSDHSVTRCLAHAIYSDTVYVGCFPRRNVTLKNYASMCYQYQRCNANVSLTCHRYVANPRDPKLYPLSTKINGTVSSSQNTSF